MNRNATASGKGRTPAGTEMLHGQRKRADLGNKLIEMLYGQRKRADTSSDTNHQKISIPCTGEVLEWKTFQRDLKSR